MSDLLPIGCLVMAAGNAARFGGNKLEAELDGKTLLRRAFEAVPAEQFAEIAVVTQYDTAAELAASFGFTVLRNERPELGLSQTVRIGTEHLRARCRAICYLVSDQPLLRRESVARAVALYRDNPERIVALSHGGVRGNPCIFPKQFFPELCALEGDRGGSAVIRRHEDALLFCETEAQELSDVDTREALRALE